MTDIKSLTFDELTALLAAEGCESYRAGQIFRWLYKDRVASFAEMTNLSAKLRERLAERFFISAPEIIRSQISSDGETSNLLYGLEAEPFRFGNARPNNLYRKTVLC